MRIARLDLTRYGKFSNYALDFGAAPSGGSDFHIVYGLNESGKSTAAAAILDLLFGIEKHSAYGAAKGRASVPNWHAYATMKIGARLELGGCVYELARLKRDKNSLVDADDRAVDENLLRIPVAQFAGKEVAPLEQQDPLPGLRQHVGQRTAAGPGADDDDVVVIGHPSIMSDPG